MLLPEDPKECFEFSAMAFDLADRLQTPVFVVTDLDMGMNDWVVDELSGMIPESLIEVRCWTLRL